MKLPKAVAAFSALAQESRLAVFLLLAEELNPKGVSAGIIAEKLQLPGATLSFHLAQLSSAGLLESTREGRMVFYRISRKKVRKLASLLTKSCKRRLGAEAHDDEDDDLFFYEI
jgi:DNA-binding transcriptional ArsR family regulator